MKKRILYFLGWFLFYLPAILFIASLSFLMYKQNMLKDALIMIFIVFASIGCIVGGLEIVRRNR